MLTGNKKKTKTGASSGKLLKKKLKDWLSSQVMTERKLISDAGKKAKHLVKVLLVITLQDHSPIELIVQRKVSAAIIYVVATGCVWQSTGRGEREREKQLRKEMTSL